MDIKLKHSQLQQLKPRELAVLALMMQSAGKEGVTTISLRELARLGEYSSVKKVRNAIEGLVDMEFVIKNKGTLKGTPEGTPTLFIIDCSPKSYKGRKDNKGTPKGTPKGTLDNTQTIPQVPTMQIIEDAVVIEDGFQAKKETDKESNKERTKEIYKEIKKERKEQEENLDIVIISSKEKNILTKGAAIPEGYEVAVTKWLAYKKNEKGSTYKSRSTIETMVNHLIEMSAGNPDTAMKIVEQSIVNNWQGLFPLKTNSNGTYKTRQEREYERRMQVYAEMFK